MNEYIIALLKCKGIGNKKLLKYVEQNKFNMNMIKKNISTILTEEDYENFENILKISLEEIDINKKHGIKLITLLDKRFPKKLYNVEKPIVYLFYKGNIDLISQNSIAIIGTRKATKESTEKTFYASKRMSEKNIVVVSGLALGIDTYAHQGTLSNNGKTIAVLPSDLEHIVPASNKLLAKEILNKNGLLVSEYSYGRAVSKYCYAERDRIQSALSDVILVIEANEKSGTMITVEKAIKENKKVYQLKGNKLSLIQNTIDIYNEDEICKLIDSINNNIIPENINKQVSFEL